MSAESEFELPSNPDDINRIKNAIEEIVAQERMIADRREGIKDVKALKALMNVDKVTTSDPEVDELNKKVRALD